MNCSCPECAISRLHDRKILRMIYLIAFLFGSLVATLAWAWR